RFGTPLYILDIADARARARRWKEALDSAFADLAGGDVYYAGKAFLSKAFARWMWEDGLYIDATSAGELQTALAGGVPGERCALHGNNKSRAEITAALENNLAHIVVDSIAELELVNELAAAQKKIAPIYLRLTSGVHAGGHEFIATAHEDQKFGISIPSGASHLAIKHALELPYVRLQGLHSHIGSQILQLDGFRAAARILLAERAWAMEQGAEISEIDFGGGYGVRYTELDSIPPTPEEFTCALAAEVSAHIAEAGLPAPRVSIEPGRSIIAPAVCTLYTVGTVKEVELAEGIRRYISVDGGMSDNIRPALYAADYTAALVSRSSLAPLERARVVGKHCESGDIVVHDVALPVDIKAGDLLAVPVTGAYGRAMASNYNMIPRPGVVGVRNGEAEMLIRRETVADLLALDLG
ncbi:diaminopimelate decarboxylase, partial [uncultured Arcanobacterium sp.]|uniref:diaminopimelate decarboxylase n=1 Tax=uncultured Arcanobacterium sp. TaxID=487520 RepID=UPI002629D18D